MRERERYYAVIDSLLGPSAAQRAPAVARTGG
jgi:hypothetical protein